MNPGWAQFCLMLGLQAIVLVYWLSSGRARSDTATKALEKNAEDTAKAIKESAAETAKAIEKSASDASKAIEKLADKFEKLSSDHQSKMPVIESRLSSVERTQERHGRQFDEIMSWLREVVRGNVPRPFQGGGPNINGDG